MNLKFWKRNLVTKHFRFHSNFWGVDVTVCSCHVTYAFQSEYTLYSCLNVKELRFKQGVPWYSGNYRVWIHSETRTWHDKNIQSDWNTEFLLLFSIISPWFGIRSSSLKGSYLNQSFQKQPFAEFLWNNSSDNSGKFC